MIRNRYIYLLALPVIVYYILFYYLPMFGIVIAFKQFELGKGVLASRWVGLKYFREYFASNNCWRTIRNTLLISFYNLLFGFPMPIIFALLMNEIKKSWFKKTVQTITYLPHFISTVVVCSMVMMFTNSNGFITAFVNAITSHTGSLISDPSCYRAIYVLSYIWQSFGWGSILYIAAMTNIDPSLYEAARIDGANRWQQTLTVTLPGIKETIVIQFILACGSLMSLSWEKSFLLQSSLTYEVSDIISTYVYRKGFVDNDYGYSAAVNIFNSLINLIMLLIANTMSRKMSESSLW